MMHGRKNLEEDDTISSLASNATFGEYLNRCTISRWEAHYINYQSLEIALKRIKERKINGERNFVEKLETEYDKYKSFIDRYVSEMEKKTMEKDDMIDIIQMNSFMSHNQDCLKEIIKRHDKYSQIQLWGSWKFRIKYKPFYQLLKSLHSVSNLYKQPMPKAERAYDNESFVRKSKKFWVANDKIVPLIAEIVKHLPVYIFEASEDGAAEGVTETSLDQNITSVYFDNNDLDIWRKRINKEDGSRLVRIRYYGDNSDQLFVERKIHYDSSVSDKESTKDRFTLRNELVMPYLKGLYKVQDKHAGLGAEVQNFLAEHSAYPFVRTEYKRIAFQLDSSNEVRLSLDLDMKLIKEHVLSNEWITPDERLSEADVYSFPYGVLEVKLQGEYVTNPPEWVKNIMEGELTIPENSFSKFGHAVYMFHSQEAGQVPSWCEKHVDTFGPHRRISTASAMPRDYFFNMNLAPVDEHTQLSEHGYAGADTINTPLLTSAQRSKVGAEYGHEQQRPSMMQRLTAMMYWNNLEPVENSRGKTIKVEPKTFFSNERTFLHWFQSGVLMYTVGLASLGLAADGSQFIGTTLCIMSFLILVYASYTYKRRNYILKHKITSVDLQDEWGPLVLVACLIGAIIVNVVVLRPNE